MKIIQVVYSLEGISSDDLRDAVRRKEENTVTTLSALRDLIEETAASVGKLQREHGPLR